MAAGYGGISRMGSTYRADVVLTVADVPYDRLATSGVTAPDPRTSQALSAAAAITGRPAGSPVASAAAGVSSPSRAVGGSSSGSQPRSTGATCHFQSPS